MTSEARHAHLWDVSGRIRDYDFTKRSVLNLNRIMDSGFLQEEDSETVFLYLRDQMEIVSFGDFLKRFIYENSRPEESYSELPEEWYICVISETFAANRAPFSFSPVTSKKRNIIRRWLTANSVRRDTVFLLGFGLNMSDEDVSMFLTKVLKEHDFDLHDPREAVFWHCFHQKKPYAEALILLGEGPSGADSSTSSVFSVNQEIFRNISENQLKIYLSNRTMLQEYIGFLKKASAYPRKMLYAEFLSLYDRSSAAAARLLEETIHKESTSRAYTMEKVLYSGIQRTKNYNLLPVKQSALGGILKSKRLDRQRLGQILSGQLCPERNDLLTLLFVVYAAEADRKANLGESGGSPQTPASDTSLFHSFIEEANAMLLRCRMWEIYPVNPYECFLLMCMLTEDPLCTFNDVWEMSYAE